MEGNTFRFPHVLERAAYGHLPLGVYRITWREGEGGGDSVASVYMDKVGTYWLAPANWVAPSNSLKTWGSIEKMVLIAKG